MTNEAVTAQVLDRPSMARTLVPLIVAVVAFGFQQTAIIPAVPVIQDELHAAHTWSAWLISGYLAASAVFTPLLGKLGDQYGQKRLLLCSLTAFLLGSIGAALAPTFPVLVLFRAAQGAGGSVFPLALAIARQQLTHEQSGTGISLLTGGFGAGTTVGFGCSGLLVEAGSWRWIFGAGALALVVGLLVVAVLTPHSPTHRAGRLGLPGAALLTGGLVLLLVALTEGAHLGWTSGWVLGAFALSAFLLAGWVWWDARATDPLLNLRMLGARPVLLTNLATIGFGFVLFGVYFLIPFVAEGAHAGTVASGLYLFPVALGQMLVGPMTPVVTKLITPRWTFATGLLLATAGSLGAALTLTVPLLMLLWTFLIGCGAGFAITVASTIAARTAAGEEVGVATALNSVLRRVGGGIGGQVVAAVLAADDASVFPVAFACCAGVGLLSAFLTIGVTPRRS